MKKDKINYNFMYQLKLLNRQYTNSITIEKSETHKEDILKLLDIFYKYKIARAILINNENSFILVWKTCDFVCKDRVAIVNNEHKIINSISSIGYSIDHNYRTFIVRNYNVCITTYHNLSDIFDYSASLIVLHSKMLKYDGIIFMNCQYINMFFGFEHKDDDFCRLVMENYACVIIANNIKIYHCFKNNLLVKQYVIIDEFLTMDKINIIFSFIQNIIPRSPEKKSCMFEIIYLITSFTQDQVIDYIGLENYKKLQYLCCYKIKSEYSSISTYNINRYK